MLSPRAPPRRPRGQHGVGGWGGTRQQDTPGVRAPPAGHADASLATDPGRTPEDSEGRHSAGRCVSHQDHT